MDDLKHRIDHIMQEHGWTSAELARRAGVSRAAVSDWRNGAVKSLSAQTAHRLAEVADVDPMWLAAGIGVPRVAINRAEQNGESTSPIVRIPRYDTGGSMGGGLVLRDQPGIIESLNVTRDWVEANVRGYSSIENLCVVTGFGDSMRGMFNSGDPLIVDAGVRDVSFDAVYFFRVDDEGFIKRLQRVPGTGLLVISANSAYRDWVIDKTMNFEVFGRVLKAWQSEDY